jgi:hypothetical protein
MNSFTVRKKNKLLLWLQNWIEENQEEAMESHKQTLWDQLSPELRARIIAILVQMLLHRWVQEMEAHHDASS